MPFYVFFPHSKWNLIDKIRMCFWLSLHSHHHNTAFVVIALHTSFLFHRSYAYCRYNQATQFNSHPVFISLGLLILTAKRNICICTNSKTWDFLVVCVWCLWACIYYDIVHQQITVHKFLQRFLEIFVSNMPPLRLIPKLARLIY